VYYRVPYWFIPAWSPCLYSCLYLFWVIQDKVWPSEHSLDWYGCSFFSVYINSKSISMNTHHQISYLGLLHSEIFEKISGYVSLINIRIIGRVNWIFAPSMLQLERGLHGVEPPIVANFPAKKYGDEYFSSAENGQWVLEFFVTCSMSLVYVFLNCLGPTWSIHRLVVLRRYDNHWRQRIHMLLCSSFLPVF